MIQNRIQTTILKKVGMHVNKWDQKDLKCVLLWGSKKVKTIGDSPKICISKITEIKCGDRVCDSQCGLGLESNQQQNYKVTKYWNKTLLRITRTYFSKIS